MIVASVTTLPSTRFSTSTRQDSRRNSGSYVPASLRIKSSNDPSAASNWKPSCSSSLTRSTTRCANASPSLPRGSSSPASAAFSTTVPLPESSETSTSRPLPTSSGSTCSNVCASARTPAACSPALCANACLPTYGCAGFGDRLSSSSTKCAVSVSLASCSGASSRAPIFSCRSATIVTRFALPVRSPMPLTVPWICVAPDSTAVSVFATAQPESSWQWIPRSASGRASRTIASAVRICGGSEPPFVSHSTSRSAPASAAARRQSSAYPGSSPKPSKKCSASSSTRLPWETRNETEEPIIFKFSSRDTRTTFSTCSTDALPTSVHTGAKHSASTRSPSSSSAATSRRRVIPNATISALDSRSRGSSSNSSASFGFDAGKPASISCTPSSSSACTTRSFSCAVSVNPPPPIPSRSVAS